MLTNPQIAEALLPVAQPATQYKIHPQRRQKMEAFCARADALKEKAKQRMAFRESDTYQQALSLLAEQCAG